MKLLESGMDIEEIADRTDMSIEYLESLLLEPVASH